MADEDVEQATEQLLGVTWEALGVLEHDGELHFPHVLKKRTKTGALREVPVSLRVVSNPRRFMARKRAREWIAELGCDEEKDKDLFSELERWELLAYIIREPKAPFDQHMQRGEDLFRTYLLPEVSEAWARHEILIDVVDGRFGKMNADEAWETILKVAQRGEPSPLSGMPGFAQATCMTLMAKAACASQAAPSSVRQRWISSLGSSQPSN